MDFITVIEEREVRHKDSRMIVLSLVFMVLWNLIEGLRGIGIFGWESGTLN